VPTTPPTPCRRKFSVEKLFANIAATQQKVLKVIIKTDVFGSPRPCATYPRGHQEHEGLARDRLDRGRPHRQERRAHGRRRGAVIIGFNTKLENGVTPLAKHHGVRIETFEIIYELGDKVREMMADLLDPDLKEVKLGAAEVRARSSRSPRALSPAVSSPRARSTATPPPACAAARRSCTRARSPRSSASRTTPTKCAPAWSAASSSTTSTATRPGDVIECYEIQKVRRRQARELRREVGRHVVMKWTPLLDYVLDDTSVRATRVMQILYEIEQREKAGGNPPSSATPPDDSTLRSE
jgi:translation initiation factor IF-2